MALKKTAKAAMPKKVMDYQDTKSSGDSRATRTCRITISTTDEIADAIDEAAHKHRMNRSRYVEWCVMQQLEREE